jgi:hypothetical protein
MCAGHPAASEQASEQQQQQQHMGRVDDVFDACTALEATALHQRALDVAEALTTLRRNGTIRSTASGMWQATNAMENFLRVERRIGATRPERRGPVLNRRLHGT